MNPAVIAYSTLVNHNVMNIQKSGFLVNNLRTAIVVPTYSR